MSEVDFAPYVSSGAFRSRSVEEFVGCALDMGLDRIELGSAARWTPDVLRPVRDTAKRSIRYLVHNYFPPHERPFVLNLAAADPDVLRQSREHCRTALDLTSELGAPFYSVHAGFAFAARPEDLGADLTHAPRVPLEEAHRIFVESLRDLCAYAASRRLLVAIENNVIAPFNLVGGQNRLGLCATADELVRTYKDVGAENLGFIIDVGHLKVTANALKFDSYAFLESVAPWVVAFHLSDNDGLADQNLPFRDDAWFAPLLAGFPRATMILEAYNLDPPAIRDACATIERARRRASV